MDIAFIAAPFLPDVASSVPTGWGKINDKTRKENRRAKARPVRQTDVRELQVMTMSPEQLAG
ncbi:hypothetical protein [Kosakonia quasisacchari]|uniref:hypothetical protein n=1 Tax=Kosakonia quasisacchari TaxID=2529380 RepID=UPI0039DF3743